MGVGNKYYLALSACDYQCPRHLISTRNMKAYTRFRIFDYKKYTIVIHWAKCFNCQKTVTANVYIASLRSRRKMVGVGHGWKDGELGSRLGLDVRASFISVKVLRVETYRNTWNLAGFM